MILFEPLKPRPVFGLDTRGRMRVDLPCYCASRGTNGGGGTQRLQKAF